MKLLVCGTRKMSSSHYYMVLEKITSLAPTAIIHGGAMGADALGGLAGIALGVPVTVFKADWATHGKAAGPIRNQQMLDEGKPDKVLAFYPASGVTPGTKDMIAKAKAANLEVIEVTYE